MSPNDVPNLRRYIAIYQKHEDAFVADIELSKDEFKLISRLLPKSEDVLFYDCYPLRGAVLAEARKILGEELPNASFEYFLECETNEGG